MATKRVGRKKTIKKPTKIDLTEGLYKAPGEFKPPSQSPLDHCFMLYGNSGIGKTSVMAEIPDSYVLQFDSNRDGNLQIRETSFNFITLDELVQDNPDYTPWDTIQAMVSKVIEDDTVKNVVIDNLEVFYDHSYNHVCYREDLANPSDANDYGATWNKIKDSMINTLQRIKDAKNLIVITHDRVKEVEMGDTTIERIEPSVKKAVFSWIQHNTNYAFYMTFNSSGERVIKIRSNPTEVWTKCSVDRKNPRFCDPKGDLVKQISAGDSPDVTWDNIMKSWNNELYDAEYKPERKRKSRRKSS